MAQKIIRDGMLSTLGGVDSGRLPSLINADQISFGINQTCRGGCPMTRPGFKSHTLTYADDEQETWFTTERFQGAGLYKNNQGDNVKVAVIGGRIFIVDPYNDNTVSEITPTLSTALATGGGFAVPAIDATVAATVVDGSKIYAGYPVYIGGYVYTVVTVAGNVLSLKNINDTTANHADAELVTYLDANDSVSELAWTLNADKWLIIQNGIEEAILYDGSTSHRAGSDEVLTGKAMAYVNGRIWVALKDNTIAASDLIGTVGSDITKFTQDAADGFRFRVDEPITALSSTATIDTSMGQGPVLVFTRNSIRSINVPYDRAQWPSQSYPIVTVSAAYGGATSHNSVVRVNSDVFYRSPDGIRSFIMARRESSTWGNVPVSSEIVRAIGKDSDALLDHISAVMWHNWLLVTCSPVSTISNTYNRGLAVLDFSLISRMGTKAPPAWEGIWTGLYPTQLVAGEFKGEERAFVWCANSTTGNNELWEIREDEWFDNKTVRIQSVLESRSFNWTIPVDLKRLTGLELWVDSVRGYVDFDIKYRPDQAPCWFNWNTKQICTTIEDCDQDETTCKTIQNYNPGYRTRMGFGQPPDTDCETQDNKPARLGYEHQVRVAWVGYCRIRKMLVKAETVPEPEYPPCE